MKKVGTVIGNWATKIESWLALGAMILGTGVFSWLGQQWALLADQGWAAVALVGIVAAALALIAITSATIAFSKLRSPSLASEESPQVQLTHFDDKSETSEFRSQGLYVGETLVSDNNFVEDRIFVIHFRIFNGTGVPIAVSGVSGLLELRQKDEKKNEAPIGLPTPSIHRLPRIGNFQEGVITIEQRIPSAFVPIVQAALDTSRRLELYLETLDINVHPEANRARPARLPLEGGIVIGRNSSNLVIGRSIYIKAHLAAGPSSMGTGQT